MDANSFTIGRFKAQCNKFSGILSKGLSLPTRRLIRELIYGIQASKDVKISNIARCLAEAIPLLKTEDRLCRNLSKRDFTDHINGEITRLANNKITDDMVLAIDPGDIMKPYAKEMEKLCGIYDGSEGKSAQGYHLCQVTAANLEHNKIVPLYEEAFSSEETGYETITKKVKEIISTVIKRTENRGVWTIDRMGDSEDIINHFENNHLHFVTRLKLNRWLMTHNKNGGEVPVQASRLEKHMRLNHKARILKIEDGKESYINLRFGMTRVALYNHPNKWYNAVVVEGFGRKHPMILLTNIETDTKLSKAVYRVIEIYLTRWKCEECYRYIKQAYNLEDLRVRSYRAVRNLTVMVHAIAYFTSIYLGMSLKLKVMVQKIFILSKRFFGVPTFFNYAMADGIFELLKKSKTGVKRKPLKGKNGILSEKIQLDLFPNL